MCSADCLGKVGENHRVGSYPLEVVLDFWGALKSSVQFHRHCRVQKIRLLRVLLCCILEDLSPKDSLNVRKALQIFLT